MCLHEGYTRARVCVCLRDQCQLPPTITSRTAHVCVWICVCVCVSVCLCICVCVCICV